VAGFFVPGLAVYLRNPGILGKMALFASGLLLSVFVIWLGYPVANLAMWFLLSAHVSGFVYYCKPLVRDALRARLVLTVLVWLALVMFIYLPAAGLIQRYWFMPLEIRDRVVVTQRDYPIESIRAGDWIGYNIPDVWAEGNYVHIRAGMGLAPVLGMPGDRIVFLAHIFTVNGIAHPSLPRMPQSGTLVIPENHWFIWPDVDLVNAAWHEGYGEQVSELLLSVAIVDRGQYFGKLFQRWFWRRQFEP